MSTSAIPQTQRALLQPSAHKTDIVLLTDHPVPTPDVSLNEHLVRVHTTAITKGELQWAEYDLVPPELVAAKVLVPCYDVAGTVVTSPTTSPFPPGTQVYARSNYNRTGSAREYTLLVTEEMSKRPQNLSWAESACVPMSAETAWQALFIHAGLKPEAGKGAQGKRVLITAASGGVGVWMVQLAKWANAEVVATCGKTNMQKVKDLGADEVLDYKETSIKQWVAVKEERRVDVVIDCNGGKSLEDAWWAVKEGGTIVSVVEDPLDVKPEGLERKDVKALFFIVETNIGELEQITRLVEAGGAKPALDSVSPIDQFRKAFERVESGKASGKVVLDFGQSPE